MIKKKMIKKNIEPIRLTFLDVSVKTRLVFERHSIVKLNY